MLTYWFCVDAIDSSSFGTYLRLRWSPRTYRFLSKAHLFMIYLIKITGIIILMLDQYNYIDIPISYIGKCWISLGLSYFHIIVIIITHIMLLLSMLPSCCFICCSDFVKNCPPACFESLKDCCKCCTDYRTRLKTIHNDRIESNHDCIEDTINPNDIL